MNREIKFRGKRLNNGEWIYGYFVKDSNGKSRIYLKPFDEATSNTWFYVDEKTVDQYTGIKDKNGKEIYDGDIISSSENINRKAMHSVFYNSEECAFNCRLKGYGEMKITKFWVDKFEKEVIGNIYENPELLQP